MQTKEQNIEEIKKELSQHDWYYEWSDSHEVYTKGSQHKQSIIKKAYDMGFTDKELFTIVSEFQKDPVTLSQWVL